MKKIVISDFSGGIQEATSPDDFSNRQWARLHGIVPRDATTFQSQWPSQRIGSITDIQGVFPLESANGTFLVGITTAGQIVWCKVPASDSSHVVAAATPWYSLQYAANLGFRRPDITNWPSNTSATTIPQPVIELTAIKDYRFLTPLAFEVYKYVKQPFNSRNWDFNQDYIAESSAVGTKATAPGVLISCTRKVRVNNFGQKVYDIFRGENNNEQIPKNEHQILVAYVDIETDVVRVAVFPNLRRWPMRSGVSAWPAGTDNEGSPAGSELSYAPMVPAYLTRATGTTLQANNIDAFPIVYPFAEAELWTPNQYTAFHPYTYLTADSALLPGRGVIPRANVGTMWGNQLILGDIEWRADKSVAAKDRPDITVPPNHAYLGYGTLNERNTEAHRGSIYYALDDIDVFDPRNVINVSGTNTRIAGMYMLDNRLICVTSIGGPDDGVIALSGNLGQLITYGTDNIAANPFAIRRQLIRGGVGVADRPDSFDGHSNQTCMWSEAGTVVFVDASGAVFYTNGQECDRLDRVGPRQPSTSTYHDHVAATGKHLFVWRNRRLYVMTILSSDGSTASGCWTELVYPTPFSSDVQPGDIRSMVGASNQMFFVAQGAVFRYCINGAEDEFGRINGVRVPIKVSTGTIGDTASFKKTTWFRTGFSFFAPRNGGGVEIESITTSSEAALLDLNPGVIQAYTVDMNQEYVAGQHYDVVVPAGIGRQSVASATIVASGNLVLNAVTFWGNGGVLARSGSEVMS